jgi:hypothetical protein
VEQHTCNEKVYQKKKIKMGILKTDLCLVLQLNWFAVLVVSSSHYIVFLFSLFFTAVGAARSLGE